MPGWSQAVPGAAATTRVVVTKVGSERRRLTDARRYFFSTGTIVTYTGRWSLASSQYGER